MPQLVMWWVVAQSCAKFCVPSINLSQNNRNEENLRNKHPLTKENTKELHGSMIGYIYGNNKKKISVTNMEIQILYRCALTNTKILKTKITTSHKYRVKIFLIPHNTLKEISLYIKPTNQSIYKLHQSTDQMLPNNF